MAISFENELDENRPQVLGARHKTQGAGHKESAIRRLGRRGAADMARGSSLGWGQGTTKGDAQRMDVTLVEIDPDIPGFSHFIGSWVCRDRLKFIVDVGPAATASRLGRSLEELGVNYLDYVLITHIHLDHAGGLREILHQFPMARAVCHEKAIPYLMDPQKLWEGSHRALGELADAYGPPKPVERHRLISHRRGKIEGLEIIETPGHASHHLSFRYGGQVFVGEAAGNYLEIGTEEYLRPATPPRFFLDVTLKSIERLSALEDQPLCYAHFGRSLSSQRMLRLFRDQLIRWKETISKEISSGKSNLVERCMDILLEKDPCLVAFRFMDKEDRARERFFMANAIKGFLGFFQENPEEVNSPR